MYNINSIKSKAEYIRRKPPISTLYNPICALMHKTEEKKQ